MRGKINSTRANDSPRPDGATNPRASFAASQEFGSSETEIRNAKSSVVPDNVAYIAINYMLKDPVENDVSEGLDQVGDAIEV